MTENRVTTEFCVKDEVTGSWRKLYKSFIIVCSRRRYEMSKSIKFKKAGKVAHVGKRRNAHRIFVRKNDGKKPPGRFENKFQMSCKPNGEDQ